MKFPILLFTFLLAAALLSPALAQQIGMPQLANVGEVTAERPLIGFTLPHMPADEMQYLRDPSVLKDLEIVDEQQKEIDAIQRVYNDRFQILVRKMMSSGADPAGQEALRKELQEFHRQRTNALSAALLPHQLVRLKQVNFQNAIEIGGGLAATVHQGELAEKLNISREQKEKLEQIQKELQEEIAEKIRESKDAARKRALEALSVDQRQKLEELAGDKFTRKHADWQEKYGKHLERE